MYGLDQLIGQSKAMEDIRGLIGRVADSSSNVLITGERGTGKELVASVIHNVSQRRVASFVPVNCGAMTEALLEAELFGRAGGIFLDSRGNKLTLLEESHKGSLFIDEINQLSLRLQAELVQAIEGKEGRRGALSRSILLDVRIIAATSLDLAKEVQAKHFREDLYYRLKVFEICLPPLRDRREDIPILAAAFLERSSEAYKKNVQGMDNVVHDLLMSYSWPGNVRELESVLERAVTLSQGGRILPEDLPETIGHRPHRPLVLPREGASERILLESVERQLTLEELEREYIRLVLHKTGDNRAMAARILGIDRRTLYRKLDGMGMEKGEDGLT